MRIVALSALTLGFVLLMSGRVRASELQDPVLYESTLAEALSAYQAREFEKAHARFVDAYLMYPNARTLRGIGVAAFELGRYADSLRALDAALVHPERPLDQELRQAVEKLILEARSHVGFFRLSVTPQDARLSVNGKPEIRADDVELSFDRGTHHIHLRAEGFSPDDFAIRVEGGEEELIRVRLTQLESQDVSPAARQVVVSGPRFTSAQPTADEKEAERRMTRLLAGATILTGATAFLGIGTLVAWGVEGKRGSRALYRCAYGRSCDDGEIDSAREDTGYDKALLARETLTALTVGAGVVAATLWITALIRARRARVE